MGKDKLDKDSSLLGTFNTPQGHYWFYILPFEIKCASEIFQNMSYETFGDIPGEAVIADDMITAAIDEAEHDSVLRKVMQRTRDENIKFNKEKI